MSKRAKIIIFLIAISFCLVLYLVFTSEIIMIKPQDNQANQKTGNLVTKVDEAQMESDFKTGIRSILSDYDKLLSDIDQTGAVSTSTNNTASIDKESAKKSIIDLKSRLTNLKAPQKMSDDAKKLVMDYLLPSFNLMSDYLTSSNVKEKNEAKSIALKIKTDFPWAIN